MIVRLVVKLRFYGSRTTLEAKPRIVMKTIHID